MNTGPKSLFALRSNDFVTVLTVTALSVRITGMNTVQRTNRLLAVTGAASLLLAAAGAALLRRIDRGWRI